MKTSILTGVFLATSLFSMRAYSQQLTVSGQVTSEEDGTALPGVSVVVQGTTTGVATDEQGNYRVDVSGKDAVLVFTFTGFARQEIPVKGRTTIDVSMSPDIAQLSEVVVTAIGVEQSRRSLVSATQEVGGQELASSKEANLLDALNAKVAGVQVTRQGGSAGAASNLVIRGMSSISGENQPLFVVDGIPVNNNYRTLSRGSSVDAPNRAIDINPNDIESVNVLKGPAATALYGIQAGSGVVIITTKKGKRSEDRRVDVNFSSDFSVDRITQEFPSQMRYAQGDGGVYGQTTFSHFGPPLTTLRYDGATDSPRDPRGNIVDMNDPAAIAGALVTPINNQAAFYETGHILDNNLNVSLGTKNSSLYFSAGDYRQSGIIPENGYNRTSFKLTGESSLRDNLRVTGSASYVFSESTRFGRGDNFADVVQGTVRTPPSFDNSAGWELPDGTQRTYRNAAGGPDNPYWTINNNPYTDEVNRFIGYFQANYDPFSWLNIMYRIGTDAASDKRKQQWARGSLGGDALPGGRVMQDTYNDRILNSDLMLTASETFGDFNLSLMAGHNYYRNATERQYFSGRGLAVPGVYTIENTSVEQIQIQYTSLKKTAALYSRFSADYKDMLYLELTGRNEWTSTLRPPNNSFFYGSAGLGFVFTEVMDVDDGVLSFGKLRASYAEAGRDAPVYSDLTYYERTSIPAQWGGGLTFALPSGVPGANLSGTAGNPDLRPERNKTLELGAELRFMRDRIDLDVTWYRNRNVDQIVPITVPGSTGFTNYIINAGEIENKGWEIMLNARPFAGNFRWDFTVNFTRNRSLVLDLPVEQIALAGFGNLRPLVKEGEPYGVFYGTAFLRDDAGNLIIGEDGYPQRNPATDDNPSGDLRIGDPNPDWTMGVRNNLGYKNFRLTFLWDFRKGGDVANVTTNWQRAQGVPDFSYDRGHMVVFKGVTADGEPNTKPVLIDEQYYVSNRGNRDIAERFIEDGSWIRLRDVTLSYSLPPSAVNRLKLSSAEIGVYGRNLLLFTGYTGTDPETNFAGPATPETGATAGPFPSMGVDAFGTPTTRSFGITLNVGI